MRGWVWLAGAMLQMATAAAAQDAAGGGATGPASTPANISVADRGRPDYAPIGGRIGSFFLYPRLDTTASYSSNLRAMNTNKVSDLIFDLRPSAQLESQWSRDRLDFQIYYERTLHAKFSNENYTQFGGNLDSVVELGTATTLTIGASGAKLTEPRTDINSNNASRSPIAFSNVGFNGSIRHDFVHFALIAAGGVARESFEDAVAFDGTPLPQGYRDNTVTNGSLEARFSIGAGTSLIAHAETTSISYDQNPFAGFDRNSRTYRLEGGVGLELTRLIYGDVRVGYLKQHNNDPRFVDGSGLSYSVNLLYSPTPLTSIRLYANRSIEPGGSTVTSGNIRSTVSVTVDHELLHNLVLTGFARYSHVSTQGFIGSADDYEGRVSALYYLSRRFRFTASVSQFTRRSGSIFIPAFDVTSGSLGVAITL